MASLYTGFKICTELRQADDDESVTLFEHECSSFGCGNLQGPRLSYRPYITMEKDGEAVNPREAVTPKVIQPMHNLYRIGSDLESGAR